MVQWDQWDFHGPRENKNICQMPDAPNMTRLDVENIGEIMIDLVQLQVGDLFLLGVASSSRRGGCSLRSGILNSMPCKHVAPMKN